MNQIKAQRSGFYLERRSDGMSELLGWPESEGYEVRFDEDAIADRALDLADQLLK